MKFSFLKSVTILVLVLLLVQFFMIPALASEGVQYYIGLKGTYHYPGGDFDGKDVGFFVIEDDGNSYEYVYGLFELVDNYGVGLTFGGYNDFAAGEISYSQSEHKLAAGGIEQDMDEAVLQMLNFDIKIFQPNTATKKIRLYGQVGLIVSALSIDDSVESYEYEVDDAFYTGYGYNLGFGIMLNVGKKLILDGSAVYQRIVYDEIRTFGMHEDVPEELTLTTRTYNIGIKYCF